MLSAKFISAMPGGGGVGQGICGLLHAGDEELRVRDLGVQSLGGGEPVDSQPGAADALSHPTASSSDRGAS